MDYYDFKPTSSQKERIEEYIGSKSGVTVEHVLSDDPREDDSEDFAVIVKKRKRTVGYIITEKSREVSRLAQYLVDVFSTRYKDAKKLFIAVPLADDMFSAKVRRALYHGFTQPGISTSDDPELVLCHKQGDNFKSFMNLIHESNIQVVLDDYEKWKNTSNRMKLPCGMAVKLSNNTVKTLHKMVHGTNADSSQPEFSGQFNVSEIKILQGKSLYKLEIDGSHSTGDKNSVNGVDKCFTYHTHPQDEYRRINVTAAWPSDDDISTVFDIITESSGVLHVLAGLEGLYFMSISPTWANRLDEIKKNKSKLSKIYQIPYPVKNTKEEIVTPHEYITEVNKRNAPFEIQFRLWTDVSPVVISTSRYIEDSVMYCKCEL
jgi:hypothetical protein